MAAANTDLLTKVGTPGTATTLAAPGFTIGNTSINVGNTANWPTDTGVVFAVDQVTTQIVNGVSTQVRVAGTYCEFEGTVASSTQINNLLLKYGTSQNYSAGSNTRVYIPVASTRENNIVTWGTAQHNQNGTHAAITVTSSVNSGNETVNGTLLLGTNSNLTLNTQNPFSGTNYVASGLVWSTVSGLNGTMTSGYVWIGGHPVSVATIASRAFTALKDTYIDVLDAANGTGTVVYTEVATNAASPALAANSVRIGICVSGASITSWNQGSTSAATPLVSSSALTVCDSLGNLIYPTSPNPVLIGYRQITSNFVLSASQTTPTLIAGLSCPVFVPVGRRTKVTAWTNAITVAGGAGLLNVWNGVVNSGTKLNEAVLAASGASVIVPGFNQPNATSATYNAGVYNTGLNNTTVAASANIPAFISVELM